MVDLRKNVTNQFMKQGMSRAKDVMGIDQNSTGASSDKNSNGPINWRIYNYPPLLRLIHYSTDELSQPYASLAKRMHICALAIIVVCSLSCKLMNK